MVVVKCFDAVADAGVDHRGYVCGLVVVCVVLCGCLRSLLSLLRVVAVVVCVSLLCAVVIVGVVVLGVLLLFTCDCFC